MILSIFLIYAYIVTQQKILLIFLMLTWIPDIVLGIVVLIDNVIYLRKKEVKQ